MNSALSISNPLWDALVHHTLLGNGQHSLSPELRKHLAELNIEQEDDKHLLLEGIAMVQLLEKGAQEWMQQSEAFTEAPDFEKEQPCSPRSMQHLKVILEGHYAMAFSEFTQLLASYNRCLPPASLPLLLDKCVQNIELWQQIEPTLGQRGLWLLRQHPIWQTLLPSQEVGIDWYKYKGEQRLKSFFAFRKQSPVLAKSSLLKYWDDFDYKLKAQILPAFSQGLSLDDEDFLESCLDHKRKEVRIIAARQLAFLADSKLIQRLFNAANHCLTIKDKRLFINLPEDLPTETKRDGILPTGSKHPGGMKLNWLAQLLTRIPFSFWENEWKLDASTIVHLFAQSGYPSLVQGITDSLLLFPNEEGTHAQIKMWVNTGNTIFWQNKTAKQLLEKASPAFFNITLTQWLEQYGPFLPPEGLITYWLINSKHLWDTQLSKIVLLGFQDTIQSKRVPDWNQYHYKSIIQAAAYQSKPELLEELKKRWYLQMPSFGRWATDIETFLQTLNFRKEMKQELLK